MTDKIQDHFDQEPVKIDTKKVAALNDQLRQTFQGGRVVITQGVNALEADTIQAILRAVSEFDNFTPDNDPYRKHDFGSVEVAGEKFFWKIDYYDASLTYHSPAKDDPSVTTRVLTIMLADEY